MERQQKLFANTSLSVCYSHFAPNALKDRFLDLSTRTLVSFPYLGIGNRFTKIRDLSSVNGLVSCLIRYVGSGQR